MSNVTSTAINEAGADRVAEQMKAAVNAGLGFKGNLYFAAGTRLIDAGEKAFQVKRQAWENGVPARDLLDGQIATAYAAEERKDVETPVEWLKMNPQTGLIHRSTGGNKYGAGLTVSKKALSQILDRAGAPGHAGAYLTKCPVNMRAEHTNIWLGQESNSGGDPVVIRTRLDGAMRGIYACVSQKYAKMDFPQAIEAFLRAVPGSAKGEFTYDGNKWRFRATFHSDLMPSEVVVGDIYQLSAWIEGVDDASGSVVIGLDAARVACVNLTTIYAKTIEGSVRHMGKAMLDKIAAVSASVMTKAAPFVDAWTAATKDVICEQASEKGVQWVFVQLVKDGYVKSVGADPMVLVERFMRAWQKEPGYCKSDIINAITRSAHEDAWRSPWATTELEAQAGELLFQKVIDLAPYDAGFVMAPVDGTVNRFATLEVG
jgi:hypothetical protein